MDLWRSLSGMVEVELISADREAAMQSMNQTGITVYQVVETGELSVRFGIRRKELKKLRAIAKRRGDSITLCHRSGAYWFWKGLLKRPVLLIGTAVMLFLTIWVPTRVLFIEVDGNVSLPTRLIIEEAARCGIRFGASRQEVRSEKMKNELLGAIPDLQWAGINTVGCRAVICVRERTDQERTAEDHGVSSIVAARDGVIREMTVVQGSPVCKVGQSVKSGQLLISGYSDLGICLRATHAEGEIFAETQRTLTAVTPLEQSKKEEMTGSEEKYSLILGKKRINFYKGSGISDATCDKMYVEHCLTLPGGFRLPVALVVEKTVSHRSTPVITGEEEAESLLRKFSEDLLLSQMIAGRIDARYAVFSGTEHDHRMTGKYACYEMIGKTHLEENLEQHETD